MTPASRRKLGLGLIIAPPVMVILALVLFAVINFVFVTIGTLGNMGGQGLVITGRVLNVLLGLMGLLGLLGFITAVPVGLFLFFTTPKNAPETATGVVLPPKN